MEDLIVRPVGKVLNDFESQVAPHLIKEKESIIILDKNFEKALLNIEECKYLDVVFVFHRSEAGDLSGITASGRERGVFASRSPVRPNPIGITTVKLLRREGNRLFVKDLDAINGSPVIDIKCTDTSLFAYENDSNPVHNAILRSEPRIEIRNHILNCREELLLLKAGQMHSHHCPGLAMGVMAAAYAMRYMKAESDGMEDLLAITETNNCFSDGIQFVTGCTFGNNALIFRDIGKTAFTLTNRDGKGIRICSRHESQERLRRAFPRFHELYNKVVGEQNHEPSLISDFKEAAIERAFGTLNIPFEELFTLSYPETEIPAYAPAHESVICHKCKESVMSTRTVVKTGRSLCLDCAGEECNILTGNGIS